MDQQTAAMEAAVGALPAALAEHDPAACGPALFDLGWVLGELYQPPRPAYEEHHDQLPGRRELSAAERAEIAGARAAVLLGQLAEPLLLADGPDLLAGVWAAAGEPDAVRAAVRAVHLDLLERLEAGAPALAAVYLLGTALRAACWLPEDGAGLEKELAAAGVGDLVSALRQSQAALPPSSAQAVAISLESWQAWWRQVGGRLAPGDAARAVAALRHQGERWRSVLSGAQQPASLLTVDAYEQAATRAVRRGRNLATGLLARFWWIAALLGAVTAGLVVLALRDAGGTAKVWLAIVPIAAGLGAGGSALRLGLRRLVATSGRPLLAIGEEEAAAASLTTLPDLPLSDRQRRGLRRAGAVPGVPVTGA